MKSSPKEGRPPPCLLQPHSLLAKLAPHTRDFRGFLPFAIVGSFSSMFSNHSLNPVGFSTNFDHLALSTALLGPAAGLTTPIAVVQIHER